VNIHSWIHFTAKIGRFIFSRWQTNVICQFFKYADRSLAKHCSWWHIQFKPYQCV